jgi:hypothetical protein
MAKRARSAGTGRIVSAKEAKEKPNETVVEKVKDNALEKRVALLERVIEEGGGNLAVLFRRRQRGLD